LKCVRGSLRYLRTLGVSLDLIPLTSRDAFFAELESAPHAVPVFDPFVPGFLIARDVGKVVDTCVSSRPLVLADFSGAAVGHVVPQLTAAGVERIISLSVDDQPEAVARNILECSGLAAVAADMDDALTSVVPETRMIVSWAVRNGYRPVSLLEAAGSMGLSTRTMSRFLARGCSMSPGELLRWSRVLHASRIAAATPLSFSRIAKVLSFSSPAALTRQFTRVAGQSPTSIPRSELPATVRKCLLAALHAGPDAD
jgi:AraC-like DNA-binding protein